MADTPLTLETLRATMAEVDLIMRPWAPLIGLVELCESPYCDKGACYALAAGFGLADSVLCRSFDAVLALVQQAQPTIARRDEVAAYLFWAITNQKPRPANG